MARGGCAFTPCCRWSARSSCAAVGAGGSGRPAAGGGGAWGPGRRGGGGGGAGAPGKTGPRAPAEGAPLPADPYLSKMWKTFWGGDMEKLSPSNRRAVVPGGWRLEVSPRTAEREDVFLSVLEI